MTFKLYDLPQLSTLNSQLSTLICHRLPNSLAKLVGARGVFETATDAFQTLEYLINFHAIHQSTHALCVSVAAAIELHIPQNAVLNFKLNGLAARALGSVSVFHWIIYLLSAFNNQLSAAQNRADS